MASRSSRSNKASCARCGGESVIASCCDHLARGMATYDAHQVGAQRVCTLCPPEAATLPLCAGCVEAVREHNVPVDGEVTYAFVRRAPYYKIFGIERDKLMSIAPGDHVKVGLSKIPLVEPRWLESPWVKVTGRAGDKLTGTIDNDLQLFAPDELAEGAQIEFTVDNVVDVMPGTQLKARAHECLQCLGAGRDLDDGDKKLLGDVRSVGFHVLKVFADEQGPGFAFTVGLHHRFGHPEVIIVGLDLEIAHRVLNRLGQAISDGEHPNLDALLEGTHCELVEPRRPDVRQEFLGYARWFYRSDEFPVRQLVWDGAMVL